MRHNNPDQRDFYNSIDFLDENLEVSFHINPEAALHLPEVTESDLRTRKEKYGFFLGKWEVSQGGVRVYIHSINEIPDDPRFYSTGVREVQINLPNIQKFIEQSKLHLPEERDLSLVGDIHTHPVLPHEFEPPLTPWTVNTLDKDDVASYYNNGYIMQDKPFIFAIAGPDGNRKTQYVFYRLVKRGDVYLVKNLENR